MTIEEYAKKIGYKGCQNCEYQISPLRACEWEERGGDGTAHTICTRWQKRTRQMKRDRDRNRMKTILVIDMPDIPKNCMSCPLIKYHHEYSIICRHYQTGDTRPTWCPLRPFPEKNTWDVTENGHVTEFAEGWNACLEELEEWKQY